MCEARLVDDAGRKCPPARLAKSSCAGRTCCWNIGAIEAATAESIRDGWFHTGDIAVRDADGYFTIHDRKKNMIVSGGENIYPAEVERVLARACGRGGSGGDRCR